MYLSQHLQDNDDDTEIPQHNDENDDDIEQKTIDNNDNDNIEQNDKINGDSGENGEDEDKDDVSPSPAMQIEIMVRGEPDNGGVQSEGGNFPTNDDSTDDVWFSIIFF